MIDIHNHVLPQTDDGSKSLDMSLKMLESAASQGITDVINTVHFMHPKMDGKNTSIPYINSKIDNLQRKIDKEGIPIKLHSWAEMFFTSSLEQHIDSPLCVFNKKYMLIEFYPHHLPKFHQEILFKIKLAGITPIIAHPERYRFVQENNSIVLDWLYGGSLIQIDAGSLIGTFGKTAKITSEYIVRNDYCQFIASDSHNDTTRNFCLDKAYAICNNLIGNRSNSIFNENPLKILKGKEIIFYADEVKKKQLNFIQTIKERIIKILG